MSHRHQPYGGQQPYGMPTQPGPGYGGHGPSTQYGGEHGAFGAPPRKKTGAIAAVVTMVALALGTLGITGFVAPGFLLGEETTNQAGPLPARPVSSSSAEPTTGQPTAGLPTGEPPSSPAGQGGPTAGGKPVDRVALAAMQTFLDDVNSGDAAAAKCRLCADGISTPADVDELIGHRPELRIDPTIDGRAAGIDSVQVYLRGTAGGRQVDGYSTNLWMTSYEGPWCVHAFRVVVV